MAASGAQTAEEFELRFAKPTGKICLSRGLWSRYLRGETVPQGALTQRGRTLIDRMDDQYPGSRDIFLHPVWELLDFEQILGPDQLRAKYLCLEETLWPQFVACNETIKPNAPSQPLIFWPSPQTEAVRKMRLRQLRGLDGLAACLIEARMGYLAQTEERFVNSLVIAGQHFQALSKEVVFTCRRMESALLVMESYGVAFVTQKTIDAPSGDEARSALRSIAKGWHRNWMQRYEAHLRTLSSSSKNTFQSWLRQVFNERAKHYERHQWNSLPDISS